jgi:hypothetical protein
MTDQIAPAEMRDSANPFAAGLSGWAGNVAGYANVWHDWTGTQFARFNHVMRISVLPEAYWARFARCIDVERGAASTGDVAGFVLDREARGHHDATAYFSASLGGDVISALTGAGIGPDRVRLWVASWDIPAQAIEIERGWIAWAHQFQPAISNNLGVDRSMIFGAQDLSVPARH